MKHHHDQLNCVLPPPGTCIIADFLAWLICQLKIPNDMMVYLNDILLCMTMTRIAKNGCCTSLKVKGAWLQVEGSFCIIFERHNNQRPSIVNLKAGGLSLNQHLNLYPLAAYKVESEIFYKYCSAENLNDRHCPPQMSITVKICMKYILPPQITSSCNTH